MSVPNLKRIAIRSKVIRGHKISKLGHVTQATPTYGSFYGPHAGGVRPLSVPNLKWIALFLQKF